MGEASKIVPVTKVAFDIRTFFTLLGIVIAGVATTVASLYSIQLNMKSELADMDRRWIERTAQVEERLRLDLNALRESLPPPEVRIKLADLTGRVERLEDIELDRVKKNKEAAAK